MRTLIVVFAMIGCAFAHFGSYQGVYRPHQQYYTTSQTRYQYQQPQYQYQQPQYQYQQPKYQSQQSKYQYQQPQYNSGQQPASRHHDVYPDGSYSWHYNTGTGVSVSSNGYQKSIGPHHKANVIQGRYSYTAADGTPVAVQYTADETGFHATGTHIPTPETNEETYYQQQYNQQQSQYNRQQYNYGSNPFFRYK